MEKEKIKINQVRVHISVDQVYEFETKREIEAFRSKVSERAARLLTRTARGEKFTVHVDFSFTEMK